MSQAAKKNITTTAPVNRAISSFVKQIEKAQGFHTINKPDSYQDFLSNKMLLVHAIRQGIPFSLFQLIARQTPFSEAEWANLLGLSTKSLQRYRSTNNYSFKPTQSEKILALAEVTQLGSDVFGDSDKFYQWLNTPNYALGSLTPLELLKNAYGRNLVIDELHRIDQGIFV